MKKIHLPTILVTLGLVGLVAILSGQNRVGPSHITIDRIIDPVQITQIKLGQHPVTVELGPGASVPDYTVPVGKLFVFTHYAAVEATMTQTNNQTTYYFSSNLRCVAPPYPDAYAVELFTETLQWSWNQGGIVSGRFQRVAGSIILGDAVFVRAGERIFEEVSGESNGTSLNTHKWILKGYLIDAE